MSNSQMAPSQYVCGRCSWNWRKVIIFRFMPFMTQEIWDLYKTIVGYPGSSNWFAWSSPGESLWIRNLGLAKEEKGTTSILYNTMTWIENSFFNRKPLLLNFFSLQTYNSTIFPVINFYCIQMSGKRKP